MGILDSNYLRKLDSFTREKKPNSTSVGGLCQIFVWLFALVYTIVYVVQTANSEWPTEVSSMPFPMESGEVPVPFTLPGFTCLAPEGCYYYQDSSSAPKCIYIPQNEKLPEFEVIYSPFPQFSVVIPGSSSNVGLGYSITKVTEYNDPLVTKSTSAQDHKIPMGMSTLNLARTVGSKRLNGDQETVDTWTTSLTTLASLVKSHGCCQATDVYVAGVDGVLANDPTQVALMATCTAANPDIGEWWTTHVNSPSYYTKIQVENPVHASVIFGLIGGWISTVTIIAAMLYFAYNKVYGKPADDTSKNSAHDQL
jgi:hypothetical protein